MYFHPLALVGSSILLFFGRREGPRPAKDFDDLHSQLGCRDVTVPGYCLAGAEYRASPVVDHFEFPVKG